MTLVDLTLPITTASTGQPAACLEKWPIVAGDDSYTANVYSFAHDSMAGTYIDFPGHVEHTDDGQDASTYPLEELYRLSAEVIHLNREDGSGLVSAEELAEAGGDSGPARALVINALGDRRFDEIRSRSVYLGRGAVDWIIQKGVHLLVSDIYESDDAPQGVFPALFGAGISTVCNPVNLHLLRGRGIRITALPLKFPTVTQLPCRLLAEIDEP